MYETEKPTGSYEIISNFLGSLSHNILNLIQSLIIASAFLILVYLFIATPHQVDGNSMHPTYKNKEYLIGNKIQYYFTKPKRGDVIIYTYDYTNNIDYLKRIIAIPNDTVELLNGSIYVNGEKLDESEYLDNTIYTQGGESLYEGSSIYIPEGHYFTTGDNRPGSYDSRNFGTIEKERIKGKVFMVVYPVSNFRIIQNPKNY